MTQYTDDTLLYCLQDGSPLVAGSQADMKTVVIGETETLVNPRSREQRLDTLQEVKISKDTVGSQTRATKRGSRTALVVAITALFMLLVLGALGIGAFLYLRDRGTSTNGARSDNAADKNSGRPEPSPSVTPRTANTRSPDPSPSPARPISGPVDAELRDEVLSEIDGWIQSTEDMDVDSLMDHYASRVDYYNRRGAGIDDIRADKNRAFSRFDDIQMNLSNIEVTQNTDGSKATVVFDKGWRFQGERTSTGKVRQLIELSKINGRWLITAERDLKVY